MFNNNVASLTGSNETTRSCYVEECVKMVVYTFCYRNNIDIPKVN